MCYKKKKKHNQNTFFTICFLSVSILRTWKLTFLAIPTDLGIFPYSVESVALFICMVFSVPVIEMDALIKSTSSFV